MDWDGKKKKLGNIFESIVFVGKEIGALVAQLGQVRGDLQGIAGGLNSVSADFQRAANALHTGMESNEQLDDFRDQYGNPKMPPYKIVEVLAYMAMQSSETHTKIDALVDRMGNQFQNEVLVVLKQENAKLERKNRELQEKLDEFEIALAEQKEARRS